MTGTASNFDNWVGHEIASLWQDYGTMMFGYLCIVLCGGVVLHASIHVIHWYFAHTTNNQDYNYVNCVNKL